MVEERSGACSQGLASSKAMCWLRRYIFASELRGNWLATTFLGDG